MEIQKQKIEEMLGDGVMLVAEEGLSDDKKVALIALMDTDMHPETILAFLSANIDDFDQKMKDLNQSIEAKVVES